MSVFNSILALHLSCTYKSIFLEGSCAHFVIDIGMEILVLYENSYEIYGDIKASINAFKVKAYEQGKITSC